MIQTRLKGMGVALITPFKEDESVDYDALMRLVDYQLQNNTDFLCVLGTTAETPTLTEEEKKKIKKMVIERVNGRIPILLGVGGNNTQAIVETLKNTIKKTSKKVSESDTTKEPQSQEKQGLAGAMNEPETGADEDQAAADDEAVDIPEATAILTADLFNLREYISEDDFYNLQEIVINCELAARKGGENENNRS